VSAKLYGSASIRPGNTGTFFYNESFRALGIEAKYEAWKFVEFDDLTQFVLSRVVAGLSISMPFKQKIIGLCDSLDSSAEFANSVNTLTFSENGEIRGFSSDLFGVRESLRFLTDGNISIFGDGALSQIFQLELKRLGRDFLVYSRKRNNWSSRVFPSDNIINCTPIGMHGNDTPIYNLKSCNYVVDLVIGSTRLHKLAHSGSVKYFSGMDFYKEVFGRQFEIYTGQSLPKGLYASILEAWRARLS